MDLFGNVEFINSSKFHFGIDSTINKTLYSNKPFKAEII